MNRNDVISIAVDVDLIPPAGPERLIVFTDALLRFALVVEKNEREACAALAEETASGRDAEAIAEAIRARSNNVELSGGASQPSARTQGSATGGTE